MDNVIVLNNSFQAVGYIDIYKAITLLYLGKAYSVKDSDKKMKSVNLSISIPMIVVVPELNYIHRNEQKCTVKGVKRRDNYKCVRCGCTDKNKLSIDHYYPRCRFERIKEEKNLDYEVNSWFNLITMCKICNCQKGSKTVEELGWDIKRPEPPLFSIDINWNEILKED
jgi:hypothetical protein